MATTVERVPLWKVGACVVCFDADREEYLDGKKLPTTKYVTGNAYVHALSVADARRRTEAMIRELYSEQILRVDFENTHVATHEEMECMATNQGFSGLERRF